MKFRTLLLVAAILAGAFLSAKPTAAQQWHHLTLRADAPGIDENPLRGFVPYSGNRPPGTFPHSLEWFYLPLSDVVKGPQTYDWTAVERQLTAISARGNQAIFRFYVDYPKKRSGIPQYLLDAGLKTFPYEDSDNAKSATPSVSPDYTDPRLIDCLVNFIRGFGAKYDGDPRIAYLTAGLYGFWGEWHVHEHPLPGEPTGWVIAQKDKDALLQAYVQSFHHTLIDIRYGTATPDRALLSQFGFHDDSFLKDTLGGDGVWQFWPVIEKAGMTESWKKYPTGGEIYPATQVGLWDAWPDTNGGQDVATAIQTIHPTWMMDSNLFTNVPTDTQRANALRAARMMGYTLFCKQFRVTQSKGDAAATVTVRMENHGVAPFYYAWPVEAIVLDSAGKEVGKGKATWPLPTLLPGSSADWNVMLDALPKSAATVLLRIPNPMQGGHSVAFANTEMSTTRDGWLTLALSQ